MSQAIQAKITSRKMWLFVVSAIVATAYGYTQDASLAEWGAVVGGFFGLYIGGNVGEHFARR